MIWGCGHGVHQNCVGNGIPWSCYVCRTALSALDVEQADAAMPGVVREQQHFEEQGDVVVPRSAVLLCCSRLGPPPDFARLGDRRMFWSQLSRSWACMACSREVVEADLWLHVPPPYCVTHDDYMCMVVDYEMDRQTWACGYGNESDVQLLRGGCAVGSPAPRSPPIDLTADNAHASGDPPGWQAELDELQDIVNGHDFSEELGELSSLVQSHLAASDS